MYNALNRSLCSLGHLYTYFFDSRPRGSCLGRIRVETVRRSQRRGCAADRTFALSVSLLSRAFKLTRSFIRFYIRIILLTLSFMLLTRVGNFQGFAEFGYVRIGLGRFSVRNGTETWQYRGSNKDFSQWSPMTRHVPSIFHVLFFFNLFPCVYWEKKCVITYVTHVYVGCTGKKKAWEWIAAWSVRAMSETRNSWP